MNSIISLMRLSNFWSLTSTSKMYRIHHKTFSLPKKLKMSQLLYKD